MYILDTNVCITLMKGDRAMVRSRFSKAVTDNHLMTTSSISIFELYFGVAKSTSKERNAAALSALIHSVDVLDFNADDAAFSGQIRAQLQQAGSPIGPYDLLIAGMALNRNATLVTANVKELVRVKGLELVNWDVES